MAASSRRSWRRSTSASRAPSTGGAAERLVLPADRVPQLREVDARVHDLTGFRIRAGARARADRGRSTARSPTRAFLSTQYIRHHSVPFYTPEPDIVHEIIGHANMLAQPGVRRPVRGRRGGRRCAPTTDAALEFFSRVFWFTIEFGVVWEDGELRAYGAGLLSSYGEIEAFRSAEIAPVRHRRDGHAAPTTSRTTSRCCSPRRRSTALVDELGAFFDDVRRRRLRPTDAGSGR